MNTRTAALSGGTTLAAALALALLAARVPAMQSWARAAGWVVTWTVLCGAFALTLSYIRNGDNEAGRDAPMEQIAERVVRHRALAHPVTAVSLLLAIATAVYPLAIGADAATIGCYLFWAGCAALVAAVAHWRLRGTAHRALPSVLARLALAEAREKARERDARLGQLHDRLRRELRRQEATPGTAAALDALETEHQRLLEALAERRDSDPLSVAVLPALADETYRRGLSLLAGAQELGAALQVMERLRVGVAEEPDDQTSELGQPWGQVIRLVSEARRCVTTLASTRVELISLRLGAPEVTGEHALTAMQQAISQARLVQEELDAMRVARGRVGASVAGERNY